MKKVMFSETQSYAKDISGRSSRLNRESAYQENNQNQREPGSVNLLCQYTNAFLLSREAEAELHSLVLSW